MTQLHLETTKKKQSSSCQQTVMMKDTPNVP